MGEITVETLPNGLTFLTERLSHTRAAAFQLLLPTGVAGDPEECQGIAHLLHGLCFRGAGERDSRALSDELDALGVQRSGGVGVDVTSFGGALLADQLPAALQLYADVVRRPWLAADDLEAERALALQEVRSVEDHPARKLFQELRRTYFPGPCGRPTTGTEEGLRAATVARVRAEHQARFRPRGSILAVAGGFQPDRLRQVVEQAFGDWQGEVAPGPVPSNAGRERYRHLPKDSAQEQIGMAYPEVEVTHPHHPAAQMAVQVLSGGASARLFTEVREKRGLVYSVHASYSALRGAGYVTVYAGTTPERSQETLEVLLHELRRLPDGIAGDELERARAGLLSALVMAGESSPARAAALASDWYLRGRVRTLDEIRSEVEAVRVADVMDHLHAHPPAELTIVTLGPQPLNAQV